MPPCEVPHRPQSTVWNSGRGGGMTGSRYSTRQAESPIDSSIEVHETIRLQDVEAFRDMTATKAMHKMSENGSGVEGTAARLSLLSTDSAPADPSPPSVRPVIYRYIDVIDNNVALLEAIHFELFMPDRFDLRFLAVPFSLVPAGTIEGDYFQINEPVRLSVTSLHPDIDEDMLSGILDPFGRIEKVEIMKDGGKSAGSAIATFRHAEDAQKAMEQLNGFELAGRAIRVTFMVDDDANAAVAPTRGPNTETIADEKVGISLGQGGRVQLMAKLAASGGVQMPTAPAPAAEEIPAMATPCFMLSNMFDPSKENEAGWAEDVREDVIEECSKNGGALHVYVDQASQQGNVYVKCGSTTVAFKSVNSLHGRWFSGKVITSNYVPANSYHDLFPDARHATVALVPGASRADFAPPPAAASGSYGN